MLFKCTEQSSSDTLRQPLPRVEWIAICYTSLVLRKWDAYVFYNSALRIWWPASETLYSPNVPNFAGRKKTCIAIILWMSCTDPEYISRKEPIHGCISRCCTMPDRSTEVSPQRPRTLQYQSALSQVEACLQWLRLLQGMEAIEQSMQCERRSLRLNHWTLFSVEERDWKLCWTLYNFVYQTTGC